MALPLLARVVVGGGKAGLLGALAARFLGRATPSTLPGAVIVSMRGDLRGASRRIDQIVRDHDVITARALNKAVRMARTDTSRELAEVKNVPQKVLKKRIRDYKASPRKKPIRASLWIGTKKPITAQELGGLVSTGRGGNVRIGRRTFRGAFPAKMPNGHQGIFIRKPGASHRERPDGQRTQLPIEEGVVHLLPEARFISFRAAQRHLKETYPRELKRLAELKLKRGRR